MLRNLDPESHMKKGEDSSSVTGNYIFASKFCNGLFQQENGVIMA